MRCIGELYRDMNHTQISLVFYVLQAGYGMASSQMTPVQGSVAPYDTIIALARPYWGSIRDLSATASSATLCSIGDLVTQYHTGVRDRLPTQVFLRLAPIVHHPLSPLVP
jgi:hypothetical protein